ncbi:hypothetical protein ALC56_12677 [Trachymyrmex septentrionalis]|uniref:Uncharacterized protein n=1 Tax=Trachymyrmex septentrionalis TaxID=34720 RepID=A0A195EXT8_9HYME|nr:hypothetical protein ALC56_12677 [Trachymyrmex septentrionalis]
MATLGQHPPALENMVPRRKRAKLRPWTTLAHVSFDLGPRLRRGNKEPLTRTIQERALSNMPTCCPKSYVL